MKNQGFINKSVLKNASGNALVIILIMIALLAALTMTLTRMSSTTNDVSQEQARVMATQIIRNINTLTTAYQGLLQKGCSFQQISFQNTASTYNYSNTLSPADKHCFMFNLAGAGLTWPKSPANSSDGSEWTVNFGTTFFGNGIERETLVQCASKCNDVSVYVPKVTKAVCQAVNSLAGVTSITADPPQNKHALQVSNCKYTTSTISDTTLLNGSSAFVKSTNSLDKTDPLWAKKIACVEAANGQNMSGSVVITPGEYFVYGVLMER